ncbi:MAG: hypothetical protein EHM46_02520, partial [Bacteroidetes bacterium]
MKKTTGASLACLIAMQFMNQHSAAQEPPLQPTGYFDRSEVILVWDDGTRTGARIQEQNIKLKFNYQGFNFGDRITGAEQVISDTARSFSGRQFDVISGDFNDDNMADYLYSCTAGDDSLHLVLATRTTTLNYTERRLHKFDGRILPGKNLVAGDLDGDGLTEFITGYREFGNEKARIAVFGFDDEFQVRYMSAIEDITGRKMFAADLCDLDGDGGDELVVGYEEEADPTVYTLRVFDFDAGFNPVPKATLHPALPFNSNSFGQVTITGVDYDGDGTDELVLAFNKNELDQPNNPDTYLYPAEVSDDPGTLAEDPLERITFHADKQVSGRFNYGHIWQILLKQGDLNGDGTPEVLLGCYGGLEIFNVSSGHEITYLDRENEVPGYEENLPSVNYFDVADMTGDDHEDVVGISHHYSGEPGGEQSFTISIVGFDDELGSVR